MFPRLLLGRRRQPQLNGLLHPLRCCLPPRNHSRVFLLLGRERPAPLCARALELSNRLAVYLSADRTRLVCAAKTNQAEDGNNIFLSLRSEEEADLTDIQRIELVSDDSQAIRFVLSDGDLVVTASNPGIRTMVAKHLQALLGTR